MKKTRVAINGAGRIGRAFIKLAKDRDELEIVAVNDLGSAENIAYLLKYDSAYGVSDFEVIAEEGDDAKLTVDGKEIKFLSEKDPANLPWGDLDIDIVIESTGVFRKYEDAKKHMDAGAKRVIISAPAKGEPTEGIRGETVLMGVNDDKLATCDISSNASCTTNASSPALAVLGETIGVEKAMLNTVHGYTASQSLVDGPTAKSNFRDGRAAAQNIIPSTTGAAIAVTKALTDLTDKFDGISVRVPVIVGSVADITFIAKKDTTVEEVNETLKKASQEDKWKGIFKCTEDEIVSSDIKGSKYASIIDLNFTRVVDGNLVKVLSWYDNEMGYTHTLVEHTIKAGSYLK